MHAEMDTAHADQCNEAGGNPHGEGPKRPLGPCLREQQRHGEAGRGRNGGVPAGERRGEHAGGVRRQLRPGSGEQELRSRLKNERAPERREQEQRRRLTAGKGKQASPSAFGVLTVSTETDPSDR